MKMSRLALATAALMLVSSPLFAARGDGAGRENRVPPHFAKIDTNGDGVLDAAEINAAEDARIAKMDINADGVITMEEIRAGREARREAMMQKRLLRMDSNGDGVVTTDEVREKGHDKLMDLDANGDGKITADEMPRHRMGKRHDGGHHGHGHGDSNGPKGD